MGFQKEVFATSATMRRPTFCTRRPIGQFSPVLLHLPTSGVGEALGRSGVLGEGHWAAIRYLGRKTPNASRSDALASAAMPSSTRKTGSSARLRSEIAGIACPSLDQLHEPALGTSRGAGVSPDTRQRVATLVGWVRSSAWACRRRAGMSGQWRSISPEPTATVAKRSSRAGPPREPRRLAAHGAGLPPSEAGVEMSFEAWTWMTLLGSTPICVKPGAA